MMFDPVASIECGSADRDYRSPPLRYQQYKGEVNMEGFTAFYEACRHPVIYNGDILTIEDIRCITEKFPKLTGVMIGRGLLANPALGWEYKEGRKLMPKNGEKS